MENVVSVCQLSSNLPGEDRYCVRANEAVQAYAVLDGHGGFLACDIAVATLLDMIIEDLSTFSPSSSSGSSSQESINFQIAQIIDAAFVRCDDNIVREALRLHRQQVSLATEKLQMANSTEPQVNSNTTVMSADNNSNAHGTNSNVSNNSSSASSTNTNGNGRIGHWDSLGLGKIMGRAGTCAVVVIITRGVIFTAHVGDCRAVLLKDTVVVGNKGITTICIENIEHHIVDVESKANGSRAPKRIKLDSKSPTKSPNKSPNKHENGKSGVLSPTTSSPPTSIQGSSQSTTHTQNQQQGDGRHSDTSDFVIYDSFLKEVEDAKKSQPLLSSQTSLKRSTRTRQPLLHEKTASDFCATYNGLIAHGTILQYHYPHTSPEESLLKPTHPSNLSQIPM